jgi:hypothetical protein
MGVELAGDWREGIKNMAASFELGCIFFALTAALEDYQKATELAGSAYL